MTLAIHTYCFCFNFIKLLTTQGLESKSFCEQGNGFDGDGSSYDGDGNGIEYGGEQNDYGAVMVVIMTHSGGDRDSWW